VTVRRAVLGAIVATWCLSAVWTGLAQEPAPIGRMVKVRNNLYVIPGEGGNTAVFVTRTGVVLVDTKLDGHGQELLDRVTALTDLPVTTIINTHAHPDHVGSNAFFSPTVDIVAHVETAAAMRRAAALAADPHALPDRTFTDMMAIGRGPDEVDVYYFGAAHTGGDAVVVFPGVRAMHAGDLFPWRLAPLVDRTSGGSAAAYPATLDQALRTITNVDAVIPGHGAVTTWTAFEEFASFTRAFVGSVQASRRAGRTASQALDAVTLPARLERYLDPAPQSGASAGAAGSARALASAFADAVYAEPPGASAR
jgi:glyoxylase-like metal-dependent hydrolase (beta-lactamase superfamily II)